MTPDRTRRFIEAAAEEIGSADPLAGASLFHKTEGEIDMDRLARLIGQFRAAVLPGEREIVAAALRVELGLASDIREALAQQDRERGAATEIDSTGAAEPGLEPGDGASKRTPNQSGGNSLGSTYNYESVLKAADAIVSKGAAPPADLERIAVQYALDDLAKRKAHPGETLGQCQGRLFAEGDDEMRKLFQAEYKIEIRDRIAKQRAAGHTIDATAAKRFGA